MGHVSSVWRGKSLTKEPLIPSPILSYPFQRCVADLFHNEGHEYLAFADRLTGWPELAYFHQSPNSSNLIKTLREIFYRYGVPEEMSLDGGPNISSREMVNFLERVKVRKSSSYYPKSNGRAEAAVKTCKRIILGNTGCNGSLDTDRVAKALIQYKNTPLKVGGKSPSQLLLGRTLRGNIPYPPEAYKVSPQWKFHLRQREISLYDTKKIAKKYHDVTVKEHDPIPVGTTVLCQNTKNKKWDRMGTIVEVLSFRQYHVRMEGSGRVSLRNRIHLRPTILKPRMLHLNDVRPSSVSVRTDQLTNVSPGTRDTSTSASSSQNTTLPEPPVLRRSQRTIKPLDRYGDWEM